MDNVEGSLTPEASMEDSSLIKQQNNPGNPHEENPLFINVGARTRRLIEKHELKVSKTNRSSLIQRALGIRKNVFVREEQTIINDQLETFKKGGVDEYP